MVALNRIISQQKISLQMLNILTLLLLLNFITLAQPEPIVEAITNIKSDSLTYLNLPDRASNAIKGSEFVNQVKELNLSDREKAVVKEILAGNVPSFSRKLRPLKISRVINGKNYEVIFFTVCDYMAIGSDDDYLYIPMTPSTAQYIADKLDCILPTKKLVDVIYNKAEIKLRPQPIPPSPKMTTIPVFYQHTDSIKNQIAQIGFNRASDSIIAGHKKDIIISNKIYSSDRNYDRVVIYGWHLSVNNPIQPVYNGHIGTYADYSHGVRLISKLAIINGDSIQITDILKDPNLNIIISSEGVINKPYYPPSTLFTSLDEQPGESLFGLELIQNYPNPFNTSTTINYLLPKTGFVKLKIFDLLGRQVADLVEQYQIKGEHSIIFDASSLASGTYLYSLQTGKLNQINKLILLK